MPHQSREQLYARTGMSDAQRDTVIWQLRRKHHTYARIAKAVGVSVGGVRASLERTAARLGQGPSGWDADLR